MSIEQIINKAKKIRGENSLEILKDEKEILEKLNEIEENTTNENKEFNEKILIEMPEEYRIFLEKYMDIVDHANFQEQQRAYYQGIVDAIQILAGLKIIKENDKIKDWFTKKITEAN